MFCKLYFAWELFNNNIGDIGSKYLGLGLYKLIKLNYLYLGLYKLIKLNYLSLGLIL